LKREKGCGKGKKRKGILKKRLETITEKTINFGGDEGRNVYKTCSPRGFDVPMGGC